LEVPAFFFGNDDGALPLLIMEYNNFNGARHLSLWLDDDFTKGY
jgi:hypothetical protein